MNIFFIAASMRRGGAERVMSILANDWVHKGHEVTIAVTQTEAQSGYEIDSSVHFVSILEKAKHPHIGLIKKIRELCIKGKADIVISFYNDICALTSIALIGTAIPVIYSERNDPNRTNQRRVDRIYRFIVETRCKGVVFQTKEAQNCYKESVIKKSVVIVNPLNISNLPIRVEAVSNKYIISVGRLTAQKRHDISIRAFATIADDYPNYSFLIYGVGELQNELSCLIESLTMSERIILKGSDPNVMKVVAQATAFILSSDYEGIPNALVEAMAIGVPCISTDCSPGGARMFINNNANGILLPCNDISKLSEAMRYLLDNHHIAEEIGKRATNIRKLVDTENISNQWITFLNSKVLSS